MFFLTKVFVIFPKRSVFFKEELEVLRILKKPTLFFLKSFDDHALELVRVSTTLPGWAASTDTGGNVPTCIRGGLTPWMGKSTHPGGKALHVLGQGFC